MPNLSLKDKALIRVQRLQKDQDFMALQEILKATRDERLNEILTLDPGEDTEAAKAECIAMDHFLAVFFGDM